MTSNQFPHWLHLNPQVARALQEGRPVVALESAVVTHGLPRPHNYEWAREVEREVRDQGLIPATIAILAGEICLGLTDVQLRRLSLDLNAAKVSRRDLGSVRLRGLDGGTTVAASMYIAHAAGLKVLSTGGIGGVHRGDAWDVSADLLELARTPIAVVCSGAKSILDLPRTLERLETAGVPVIGWQTDEFPAFFTPSSGLRLTERINCAQEAAEFLDMHWGMGLASGVLFCVPCPPESAVPWQDFQTLLQAAEREASAAGTRGGELTPFLLNRLSELSAGATLRANRALLKNNVRVASEIARALVDS